MNLKDIMYELDSSSSGQGTEGAPLNMVPAFIFTNEDIKIM